MTHLAGHQVGLDVRVDVAYNWISHGSQANSVGLGKAKQGKGKKTLPNHLAPNFSEKPHDLQAVCSVAISFLS